MNTENLFKELHKSDANFCQVSGNKSDTSKYHIHYSIPKIIAVPRKSKPYVTSDKSAVFGHIYVDNNKDVFWIRFANNSSSIIGHNCILEIFNLLTESPIKVKNKNGTEVFAIKITESDLKNIIIPNLLSTISKPIYLKDVDLKF